MNPNDFKILNSRMECEFPESPIFWEASASIVKNHLPKYNNWARNDNGFWLSDEKNRIRLSVFRRNLRASIESPTLDSKEIIQDFSKNIKNFSLDLLEAYQFSSVSNAEYSYRFFKNIEISDLLPGCEKNIICNHEILDKKFGKNLIDFGCNFAYPYKKFWTYMWIYLVYKEDIKEIFPLSVEECGDEGLVVTVSFASPKNNSLLSIEDLKILYEIQHEEFLGISSLVIQDLSFN